MMISAAESSRIYYRTLPSLEGGKEPSLKRVIPAAISEINWLWEVRSGERGASSRQRKESAAKAPNSGNWSGILGARRKVVRRESDQAGS